MPELIDVTIDKVVFGGDGIARHGEVVVFVPYTAPGDRLRVKVVERKKNYWQGRLEEVIEPSPLRVPAPCPYYGYCGGCDMQHISYEGQLVTKKLIANEALQRIGKVFVPPENPPVSMPWRYRNKSQFPVSGMPWRIGYFHRHSHSIINIAACLVQPELMDRLLAAVRARVESSTETPYSEYYHSGNLRHIVFKHSAGTGQAALGFVTATGKLDPALYTGLGEQFPELVSIFHNANPEKTNRILGQRFETLAGKDVYAELLLGKQMQVSAGSFFQANSAATEQIVKRLLKWLEPDGNKTLLDLYSGIGTLSLPIAGFVGKVIAIEMSADAVRDCRANCELNAITNYEVIQAEAEAGIRQVEHADAVLLDPPRKGCTPELLKSITNLKPEQILYVSCNPTTLARDLALLREQGYEAKEIRLADMFPQTSHIECIARIAPARL